MFSSFFFLFSVGVSVSVCRGRRVCVLVCVLVCVCWCVGSVWVLGWYVCRLCVWVGLWGGGVGWGGVGWGGIIIIIITIIIIIIIIIIRTYNYKYN